MSARRKNSARLKRLRSYGVPIDGDYNVPAMGLMSRRLTPRLNRLMAMHAQPYRDRDMYYVPSAGQRAIIAEIRG